MYIFGEVHKEITNTDNKQLQDTINKGMDMILLEIRSDKTKEASYFEKSNSGSIRFIHQLNDKKQISHSLFGFEERRIVVHRYLVLLSQEKRLVYKHVIFIKK